MARVIIEKKKARSMDGLNVVWPQHLLNIFATLTSCMKWRVPSCGTLVAPCHERASSASSSPCQAAWKGGEMCFFVERNQRVVGIHQRGVLPWATGAPRHAGQCGWSGKKIFHSSMLYVLGCGRVSRESRCQGSVALARGFGRGLARLPLVAFTAGGVSGCAGCTSGVGGGAGCGSSTGKNAGVLPR